MAHEHGGKHSAPIQKGRLSLPEALEVSQHIYGGISIIPAIPMKKDATVLDELCGSFAEARPDSVHLLGLGAKNEKTIKIVTACQEASPGTVIYMDSVFIRSVSARTGGPYGGARDVTAAADAVKMHVEDLALHHDREYMLPRIDDMIINLDGALPKDDIAFLRAWRKYLVTGSVAERKKLALQWAFSAGDTWKDWLPQAFETTEGWTTPTAFAPEIEEITPYLRQWRYYPEPRLFYADIDTQAMALLERCTSRTVGRGCTPKATRPAPGCSGQPAWTTALYFSLASSCCWRPRRRRLPLRSMSGGYRSRLASADTGIVPTPRGILISCHDPQR